METVETVTDTVYGYNTLAPESVLRDVTLTVSSNNILADTSTFQTIDSTLYYGDIITFAGALVFDTLLNKWGKYIGEHQIVVDYNPVNAASLDMLPSDRISMDAGILTPSKELHIYDERPAKSFVRYGTLGYYRLGTTQVVEVRAQFKKPFSGIIEIGRAHV